MIAKRKIVRIEEADPIAAHGSRLLMKARGGTIRINGIARGLARHGAGLASASHPVDVFKKRQVRAIETSAREPGPMVRILHQRAETQPSHLAFPHSYDHGLRELSDFELRDRALESFSERNYEEARRCYRVLLDRNPDSRMTAHNLRLTEEKIRKAQARKPTNV